MPPRPSGAPSASACCGVHSRCSIHGAANTTRRAARPAARCGNHFPADCLAGHADRSANHAAGHQHSPAARQRDRPSRAHDAPGLLATDLTIRPDSSVAAPIIAPTTAPVATGNSASDARQRQEAGDLVGARDELNASLVSGHLSEADADAVRHQIADINQTLVFSPERTPNDPWAGGYRVESGERLATIAGKNSVTWQLLSRINHVDPKRLRAGATIKIVKGPFFAVVTKGKFRMDLYFGGWRPGSMYVRSFGVGLGKNDSTPTGTWQVQSGNKVLHPVYYSPDNHGVIEANDPKNPLGGYWIGLEGVDGQAVDQHSYGIHGTIDPARLESRLRSAASAWVTTTSS